MIAPNEQDRDARRDASKQSRNWKFTLAALAAVLCGGIVLRMAGLSIPAWILVALGAALAFVFILPARGGRMHEPEGTAFKKAPWGF